jgi:hypothetical protein
MAEKHFVDGLTLTADLTPPHWLYPGRADPERIAAIESVARTLLNARAFKIGVHAIEVELLIEKSDTGESLERDIARARAAIATLQAGWRAEMLKSWGGPESQSAEFSPLPRVG